MNTAIVCSSTVSSPIMNRGIDTIILNVRFADARGQPSKAQALPDGFLELLASWQEQARQEGHPTVTPITFHYARMCMYPNGASGWHYILRNDCLEIKIVPRLKLAMFAKVTLSSSYLWSMGSAEQAVDEVHGLLIDLFGTHISLQPSQIDVCVDLVGLALPTEWEEVFVTHALKKRPIGESQKDRAVYKGRSLQTIIFSGHGCPVNCKLYNKVAEIRQHSPDKVWFHKLWKDNGWDEEQEVWRIEFSVERAGLNEMNLQDIYEALRNVKRMWQYCTQQWLRMVVPGRTKNRTRWRTHPTWITLQHAFDTYGDRELDGLGPLTREKRREKNFDRGVAALAGYITTLAAWYDGELNKEVLIEQLFTLVQREVTARWDDLAIDPDAVIQLKKFIYSQKP